MIFEVLRAATVYAMMSGISFEDVDLQTFCTTYLAMPHALLSAFGENLIAFYRQNIPLLIAKVLELKGLTENKDYFKGIEEMHAKYSNIPFEKMGDPELSELYMATEEIPKAEASEILKAIVKRRNIMGGLQGSLGSLTNKLDELIAIAANK